MTLLEHIQELRMRVAWAGGAVVLGMLLFFVPPIGFGAIHLLLRPAVHNIPNVHLQAISPMENVIVYFRVALLGGVALGMPMLVFQAMRFVSPGLTRVERRWSLVIAGGGSVMFVAGLAFGYLVTLPAAYGFLFRFGSSFARITPTIESYINLTTRLLLVNGLVFEMPLLMMGLAKFGLVPARTWWRWWRYALPVIFLLAAIATPPDALSQVVVAVPMVVLYFVGAALAWVVRR